MREDYTIVKQERLVGPLLTTFGASLVAHEESLHCFFSFLFFLLAFIVSIQRQESKGTRGASGITPPLGRSSLVDTV